MTNVPTGPAEVRQEAVPESGIRTYVLLWISQWLACAAVSFTVFVVGVNIFVDFYDSLWLIALGYAILFVPFPSCPRSPARSWTASASAPRC